MLLTFLILIVLKHDPDPGNGFTEEGRHGRPLAIKVSLKGPSRGPLIAFQDLALLLILRASIFAAR